MLNVLLLAAALLVGTNAEFPPFSYIENSEIVGFDIDVAKEVAKRLHREIRFKDVPFDALIPEIVLGRVDFAAAGLSYTEERAKRALFSNNYLSEDPLVIFTLTGQQIGPDKLKGKTIAVVEGFTADLWASSQKDLNLIRLPTQGDAFIAIKSGRVDAFVTAKSTVEAFFANQERSKYATSPIPGTGETCALVVPKERPELLALIQQALDEMTSDGTMERLKSHWKLK